MEISKKYYHDSRSPSAVNEAVSKSIRGNRGINTKPELELRKALWKAGIRGYRLHWKKVPGRPDISFPGRKVAIFVNGCYWHRCPHCDLPLPKAHREFWKDKFETNKARDKRKFEQLIELDWQVLTIWECRIKKELDLCVEEVRQVLNG